MSYIYFRTNAIGALLSQQGPRLETKHSWHEPGAPAYFGTKIQISEK